MKRRQLLGSLVGGAGAFALDPLGACRAAPVAKAKSCIFLFMDGGPSQFDLWSYKPKLNELDGQSPPEELLRQTKFAFVDRSSAVLRGSPRKFSQYGPGGLWLSDLLPHLAGQADKLCQLGAVVTSEVNHHPAQLVMHTGHALPGYPSLGSWLSYGLGSGNPDLPSCVSFNTSRLLAGGVSLWGSGFLPASTRGVLFGNQPQPLLHLERPGAVSLSEEELTVHAIQRLNALRASGQGLSSADERSASYQLALNMQGALPGVVDLQRESESVRERYGMGRSDPDVPINQARKPRLGVYDTFARQCLLARRLVEQGVRMVNVFSGSWDMHDTLDEEMGYFAGMVDQPVSALLQDLSDSGLLEETLVVIAGEFGRTPVAQLSSLAPGRDHHASAFPVFLAGAGVQGGLVYGETDELGWNPIKDTVDIADLHATILHLMGLDHRSLTVRHNGLEQGLVPVEKDARPIEAVLV